MSPVSSRTYDNLGVFSVDAPTLLPTTLIPLQLRDPADIELARHAIETGEMIGLVTPELPAGGEGATSIQLASLAQISDFAELHDGRLLLLLRGVERIQIIEDLMDESSPSRRVRAQRLEAPHEDTRRDHELRRAILGTLLALASVGVHGADIIHNHAVEFSTPGDVADYVGARILLHPSQRLDLFREINPTVRLEIIEDVLAHMLLHHTLDHYESDSVN